MVSEENRLGLFISLPVYFACLAACAVWAHFKMERLAQKSGEYLPSNVSSPSFINENIL